MNPPESRQKFVSQIIRNGIERCAECLTRICRAGWSLENMAVGAEAEPCFEALLAGTSHDHLGSYLSLPGGAFLLMFDPKSGLRVSTRFIGDFSDKVSMLDKSELQAIAEISNILINILVDALASECNETLLLSAPEPLMDSRRDILISALDKFRKTNCLALTGYSRLHCPDLSSDCTFAVFLEESFINRLISGTRT